LVLIDHIIFVLYMLAVLGVGFFHFRRNTDVEDYYVGGRGLGAGHVGMSVVATDVGGGFSIGLGGLGFTMGLSGSWLLFTGLLGAWLSAVLIIPRIKDSGQDQDLLTYPDLLRRRYGARVALLAAVISGIGYLGFTGAQMLAGAKLAAGTIFPEPVWGMEPLEFALIAIAGVTILYTALGGLKAVIYTDSVQWLVLLGGLILVAIPSTFHEIGGWARLRAELPPEFFTLTNISITTAINWVVTIVPIWLIGMTLYQRIYACSDTRTAKRAWYLAGLLEWPVMAFMGVILGMCARVMFPAAEPEMALPMLVRDVLPLGVTGLVVAAYFSAIMSTADSCLMASSGNIVNDLIGKHLAPGLSDRAMMRLSLAGTAFIGVLAVLLASRFRMVLDAILYAYAFMVSGLFAPTLALFFWPRATGNAAFWSMLGGGGFTLTVSIAGLAMPAGLSPTLFGILISGGLLVGITILGKPEEKSADTA
jgi:SSS family solute:Na+ symporter